MQMHQFKEYISLEEFKNDLENYKLTPKDKIEIFFRDIKEIYYNFINGIKNIFKYFKIIWKDRWWDYYFFEELLLFKLKDMEKHWGEDTHYIGDCFTKKRIQLLIKKLEEVHELEDKLDKKASEKRKEFYKLLGRNIERFWD